MERHTPGPWKATPCGTTIDIVSMAPGCGSVAMINSRGNSRAGIPNKQDRMNGRLIATAPELLEALEAIVARINGDFDSPALQVWGPLLPDATDDIKAIAQMTIAKAKGE